MRLHFNFFNFFRNNSLSAWVIKLFGKWFAAKEIIRNSCHLGDDIKHRGNDGGKPGDRKLCDSL